MIDPATLALIVAVIAALGGVVQGTVQGMLMTRSAKVNARQEAARAVIELCDQLLTHLAAMAQAANEYGLCLADEAFLNDWNAREPLIHKILTAHGLMRAAYASLPVDSSAREPVERAMRVCTELPGLRERSEVLRQWKNDNHAIPEALDAVGGERARQLAVLGAASRPWWARKRASGVRFWGLPFTSKRRELSGDSGGRADHGAHHRR